MSVGAVWLFLKVMGVWFLLSIVVGLLVGRYVRFYDR